MSHEVLAKAQALCSKDGQKDGRTWDKLAQGMRNAYLHNAELELGRGEVSSLVNPSNISSVTGLKFGLSGVRSNLESAEELDQCWRRTMRTAAAKMKFPFTVGMPCGRTIRFDDAENLMSLGIEDIRCNCGNPKHWMVRFKDNRKVAKLPTAVVVEPAEPVTAGGISDSTSGTGKPDSPAGSKNSGKSDKPKKHRKAKKAAKKSG